MLSWGQMHKGGIEFETISRYVSIYPRTWRRPS